jgi:hypothetical protein
MILGRDATERFGRAMVTDGIPIDLICEKWGISDRYSKFVEAAAGRATHICREEMNRKSAPRDYLLTHLLPWPGWPLDVFKKEASDTIFHPATETEVVRGKVRLFVLSEPRLGDPRLSLNKPHWAGMFGAEKKVIAWLSQLDIQFFFDHVLPQGGDPHRRKEFWLRYKGRVQGSRPLLCPNDRIRLKQVLQDREIASAAFGRIEGFPVTSAFLLDFGKLVVVEFSVVGNGCRIYKKEDFARVTDEFWSRDTFEASELKQRFSLTKRPAALWDGVHRIGWREDASRLLSVYGVR